MKTRFLINPEIKAEQFEDLLTRAHLELSEKDALHLAYVRSRANLIVAALEGRKLVGLALCLKEVAGCCHVSDLIVDRDYRSQGLGVELIRQVHQAAGKPSLVMLTRPDDAAAFSLAS